MLQQGRGQRRAMTTPSTLATRQRGDEWEQGQAHFAVAVALPNFPGGTDIQEDCKEGPSALLSKPGLYVCCMRWILGGRHAYSIVFRRVQVQRQEGCLVQACLQAAVCMTACLAQKIA